MIHSCLIAKPTLSQPLMFLEFEISSKFISMVYEVIQNRKGCIINEINLTENGNNKIFGNSFYDVILFQATVTAQESIGLVAELNLKTGGNFDNEIFYNNENKSKGLYENFINFNQEKYGFFNSYSNIHENVFDEKSNLHKIVNEIRIKKGLNNLNQFIANI